MASSARRSPKQSGRQGKSKKKSSNPFVRWFQSLDQFDYCLASAWILSLIIFAVGAVQSPPPMEYAGLPGLLGIGAVFVGMAWMFQRGVEAGGADYALRVLLPFGGGGSEIDADMKQPGFLTINGFILGFASLGYVFYAAVEAKEIRDNQPAAVQPDNPGQPGENQVAGEAATGPRPMTIVETEMPVPEAFIKTYNMDNVKVCYADVEFPKQDAFRKRYPLIKQARLAFAGATEVQSEYVELQELGSGYYRIYFVMEQVGADWGQKNSKSALEKNEFQGLPDNVRISAPVDVTFSAAEEQTQSQDSPPSRPARSSLRFPVNTEPLPVDLRQQHPGKSVFVFTVSPEYPSDAVERFRTAMRSQPWAAPDTVAVKDRGAHHAVMMVVAPRDFAPNLMVVQQALADAGFK